MRYKIYTIILIFITFQLLIISQANKLYIDVTVTKFVPLPKNKVKQIQIKRKPIQILENKCIEYLPLLEKYDWNVQTASKVMLKESNCNPKAKNMRDNHYNIKRQLICSGSHGLMQVACSHYLKLQITDKEDPVKNVEIAYQLYKERGWKPWGVCTDGKVKCF